MDKIVDSAFSLPLENGKVVLSGVVSRKKQLVPALTRGIQEMQVTQ